MVAFAFNDAFAKLAAQQIPPGEVVFGRSLGTTAILVFVVAFSGELANVRRTVTRPVLVRAIADVLATILFIVALVHMNIAEVTAVVLSAPLVMTAFAVMFYGEKVGWRRWCAVFAGLVGTLMVAKPSWSAVDAWALLAFGGAVASASRDLLTRHHIGNVSALSVTLISSVAITVAGLGMTAIESWSMPNGTTFMALLGAAVALGIGMFLIVHAFRDVEISVVAPFRYTLLIWAALFGYFIFNEVPDRWSVMGASLIVGSGLYALHREGVRKRDITATAQPPA